ncbi:hypothetical protein AB0M23_26290 [Streptomyces sp. NPDC052077]|uniref:hypothetical protein n=1 Tax=Streptomyces sp. NPDC052077 TaxID=3154757 RepID=UPI00343967BB
MNGGMNGGTDSGMSGGAGRGVNGRPDSGTTGGADRGFALPRGATGFAGPGEEPLPVTGPRSFRAALYAAARAAGGRVGAFEHQEYPRTFHTASVVGRDGETVVLCHAHLPWVAFARERRNRYAEEFLPPPPWAAAFTEAGLTVLGGDLLALPLARVDTSGWGRYEWRRVRLHGVHTLGGVLFNAWD